MSAENPYVAEIRMFPFNFPPRGWAFCDGQLLPISQNTALFSLLGTIYGGNGQTTFALPNLQGRAAMHVGNDNGPGLSDHDLGEESGLETITLLTSEIPAHTHQLKAKALGGQADPLNRHWGSAGTQLPPPNFYADALGTSKTMNPTALSINGSSFPHNNLMPYLVVNFCIAMQGVFPSRG
jgi:microcystin-dependent protein